jgi:hypothetical protein
LKTALANDIWFHVDKLSSAHVYLRLQPCRVIPPAQSPSKRPGRFKRETKSEEPLDDPDHVYCTSFSDLPAALIREASQLTKANSIEGCKNDNIGIVYTPAHNLLKSGDMAVGSVSFINQGKVKRAFVPTKDSSIVNRLTKTKTEHELSELIQLGVEYERKVKKEALSIAKSKVRYQMNSSPPSVPPCFNILSIHLFIP